MRRAATLLFTFAALFVSASCKRGRGEHSCAVDPVAGCICKNATFEIGATQKAAQECAAPPADAPWHCCHDLDSKGESNECWCARGICRKSDRGFCGCEFTSTLGSGYILTPQCEPASGQKCCERTDKAGCNCDVWDRCPSDSVQVDRCLPANLKPGACLNPGRHESKTCDGLTWKRKT